jgi:Lactonase, 7-bladed beta-propeller
VPHTAWECGPAALFGPSGAALHTLSGIGQRACKDFECSRNVARVLGLAFRFVLSAVVFVAALLALAAGALAAPRLYEPSYLSGSPEEEFVGGFETGVDGSLSPLTGSPFATVTGSSPLLGIAGLAFTPDGTRAVAGFSVKAGVQGLSVSAAGALAPVGSALPTASGFGFAVSPDGRFAYLAAQGTEDIRVFSIAADGSLTSLGSGFGSGEYRDIAITPDGRHLFAADHSTERLARFAIDPDGSLTSLAGETAVPLDPDNLAVSPDGRFLFVVFYDGFTEEGFTSYAIGADGGLEEVGEPVLPTGDSLRYLAVSPDGATSTSRITTTG